MNAKQIHTKLVEVASDNNWCRLVNESNDEMDGSKVCIQVHGCLEANNVAPRGTKVAFVPFCYTGKNLMTDSEIAQNAEAVI